MSFSSLESLNPPVTKQEEEIDIETKQLSAMAFSEGWKVFEQRVDAVMKELDSLVKSQISSGADYTTIGQSTVAKELTQDVIRRLLSIVSDARESVESRGKTVGGE